MDIHIYVSYHKPFMKIEDQCFIPIQTGRAIAAEELDMIGDNTGENISHLNPAFSELVSQYWAWKNDRSDCDYIGFLHYRRYLNFNKSQYYQLDNKDIAIREFGLNQKDIEEAIAGYDFILPSAIGVGNMYRNTCNPFGPAFADKLIATMKAVKPEYSNAIDRFYNSSTAYLYNLYIMKKELYDEFCEFMFGTLLSLREEIGLTPPISEFPRFFGYTAEQFINIYMDYLKEKRDIKILTLSTVKIEEIGDKYQFNQGGW